MAMATESGYAMSQRQSGLVQVPVTMSSIARQRREQVGYTSAAAARADSQNAETDRVVWPKPTSFKPRTHDRRHGQSSDQARAPRFVASPAKPLPPPESGPDTDHQDDLT